MPRTAFRENTRSYHNFTPRRPFILKKVSYDSQHTLSLLLQYSQSLTDVTLMLGLMENISLKYDIGSGARRSGGEIKSGRPLPGTTGLICGASMKRGASAGSLGARDVLTGLGASGTYFQCWN